MKKSRRTKTKFLDPAQIEQALDDVARSATNTRVALAGGAALQIFGSPRFTRDVDFLASGVPAGFEPVKALSFGGVSTRSPSNVPTDFIIRDDDYAPLYTAALDEAEEIEGVPVPVVTPEYLAALKMAAARKKDELDLEWLIAADVIDIPATRAIIAEFLGVFAAREFDAFAAETLWKRAAGRL